MDWNQSDFQLRCRRFYWRIRAPLLTVLAIAYVALVAWFSFDAARAQSKPVDFQSVAGIVFSWIVMLGVTFWIFVGGFALVSICLVLVVEWLKEQWNSHGKNPEIKPIGWERRAAELAAEQLKRPPRRSIAPWVVGIAIVVSACIYAISTRYSYYPSTRTRFDHWTGTTSKR